MEETPRFVDVLHVKGRKQGRKSFDGLEIVIVRSPIVRRLGPGAFSFSLPDVGCEDRNNPAYDLVLYCENVFELAIIVFGPMMPSRFGVDQPDRYA